LVAIAVVTYMMILAWQKDYVHVPDQDQATITDTATQIPDDPAAPVPQANAGDDTVPSAEEVPAPAPAAPETTVSEPQAAPGSDRIIRVRTDVLEMEIDRLGGDIVRLSLLDYPRRVDTPDQPFTLLERSSARTYVAQSGIVGANGTDSAEGRPTWQAEKAEYQLLDGEYEMNVDLTLRQANGVEITKRFTFERGSHLIRQSHIVRNHGSSPWQGALYGQIKRDGSDDPGKATGGFAPMPTYLGSAYWNSEKPYNKLRLKDMKESGLRLTEDGGWIAMIQHYFLSAWIPDSTQRQVYSSVYRSSADEYILRFVSPATTVAPGDEGVLYAEFYAGPTQQDELSAISPGPDM